MKLKTLQDLLLYQLKDLYSSEQQIWQALHLMAETAYSTDLRQAFLTHIKRTGNQISRLEKVFLNLNLDHNGEWCEGMEGLINECRTIIRTEGEPELKDTALITAAQKVDHYEITCYTAALTYARELGFDAEADLLQESLDEENNIKKELTNLAKGGFFSSETK
ncbi:protein of unknown function DUF892 [Chitinispirillum alkaliphilum]|nr:protein of unknown function DUF892 [Chitinispirillum alkaliphilum]